MPCRTKRAASSVGGDAKNRAVAHPATMVPAHTRSTSSATARASCRSCVTSTVAAVFRRCLRTSINSARSRSPTPQSGSSSSSVLPSAAAASARVNGRGASRPGWGRSTTGRGPGVHVPVGVIPWPVSPAKVRRSRLFPVPDGPSTTVRPGVRNVQSRSRRTNDPSSAWTPAAARRGPLVESSMAGARASRSPGRRLALRRRSSSAWSTIWTSVQSLDPEAPHVLRSCLGG